jgi:hypothetical protein
VVFHITKPPSTVSRKQKNQNKTKVKWIQTGDKNEWVRYNSINLKESTVLSLQLVFPPRADVDFAPEQPMAAKR